VKRENTKSESAGSRGHSLFFTTPGRWTWDSGGVGGGSTTRRVRRRPRRGGCLVGPAARGGRNKWPRGRRAPQLCLCVGACRTRPVAVCA
jgi:hypothetical protein